MESVEKNSTTKWHWVMLVLIPLTLFIEAIVTHSFGTVIGNITETDPSLLVQLNCMTTLASALPALCLPLLLAGFERSRCHYQVYCAVGFALMTLSVFTSSLVSDDLMPLLFLTYSLTYGAGCALVVAVAMVQISGYFPPDHPCYGVATSLFQIGYPLASGVGNPLMAFLIGKTDWRTTMRIFGGSFLFFGSVVSLLHKPAGQSGLFQCPPPDASGKESEIQPDLSQQEVDSSPTPHDRVGNTVSPLQCSAKLSLSERIRATPQLFPWLLAKFLNYICWFSLRTNIVSYFDSWSHFPLQQAANLMTAYACAEIVTALLSGALLGRWLRGHLLPLHVVSCAGLAATCLLWSTVVTSYLASVVGVVFIGIFVQLSISFGYAGSVEVTGWEMNAAWSTTLCVAGLGILSSTSVAALSVDLFGRLDAIFWIIGVSATVSTLLYIATFVVLMCRGERGAATVTTRKGYEEVK